MLKGLMPLRFIKKGLYFQSKSINCRSWSILTIFKALSRILFIIFLTLLKQKKSISVDSVNIQFANSVKFKLSTKLALSCYYFVTAFAV